MIYYNIENACNDLLHDPAIYKITLKVWEQNKKFEFMKNLKVKINSNGTYLILN